MSFTPQMANQAVLELKQKISSCAREFIKLQKYDECTRYLLGFSWGCDLEDGARCDNEIPVELGQGVTLKFKIREYSKDRGQKFCYFSYASDDQLEFYIFLSPEEFRCSIVDRDLTDEELEKLKDLIDMFVNEEAKWVVRDDHFKLSINGEITEERPVVSRSMIENLFEEIISDRLYLCNRWDW